MWVAPASYSTEHMGLPAPHQAFPLQLAKIIQNWWVEDPPLCVHNSAVLGGGGARAVKGHQWGFKATLKNLYAANPKQRGGWFQEKNKLSSSWGGGLQVYISLHNRLFESYLRLPSPWRQPTAVWRRSFCSRERAEVKALNSWKKTLKRFLQLQSSGSDGFSWAGSM